MATSNRKTNGKRSAKERMEESMRQQTGENAAMAYLKFLRDTDHRGTLDEVAFGMTPRRARRRSKGKPRLSSRSSSKFCVRARHC